MRTRHVGRPSPATHAYDDEPYGVVPPAVPGIPVMESGAATSGMATAFFALARFALRGFLAAFIFFAGVGLAFFTLRLATLLALTFFLDFFALRAMCFSTLAVLIIADPGRYETLRSNPL
jgi:hypothetical protein